MERSCGSLWRLQCSPSTSIHPSDHPSVCRGLQRVGLQARPGQARSEPTAPQGPLGGTHGWPDWVPTPLGHAPPLGTCSDMTTQDGWSPAPQCSLPVQSVSVHGSLRRKDGRQLLCSSPHPLPPREASHPRGCPPHPAPPSASMPSVRRDGLR